MAELTRRNDSTTDNPFDRFFGPAFLDRFFGQGFSRLGGTGEGLALADWAPAVDVRETDASFHLSVELPKVKAEDVKVTVDKGVLTLSGERKWEKKEDNEKVHRIERSYGSFTRRFTLPDNVDAEHIAASFKDGVLEVDLPKKASAPTGARSVPIG